MNEINQLFNEFLILGGAMSMMPAASSFWKTLTDVVTAGVAIGSLVLAISVRNDWQKKVKCEKFENWKVELIYTLIDLTCTLEMHCNYAQSVSQMSELNPEVYEHIGEIETNRREINNIDIELVNKYRKLTRALKLFEFYTTPKDKLLVSNLKHHVEKLHSLMGKVLELVMFKFSMYAHGENDYIKDSFNKRLNEIQKPLKDMLKVQDELLEHIKGI